MFERLRAAWAALTATSQPGEAKASAALPLVTIGQAGVARHARWGGDKLAREGYAANIIAYLCIRLVADAVATLPLLFFRGDTETPEHPLALLLRRPNPARGQARFLQELVTFHLITGNSFIEAVRPGPRRPPKELYALNPRYMSPILGPDGLPAAWRFEAPGGKRDWPIDRLTGYGDVLHLREANPLDQDPDFGLAPTQAAARWIDLDNAAADLNLTLANGVNPSLALVNKAATTQEQMDQARAKVEQRLKELRRSGMPLMVGGDWSVQKLSDTLKDMQWSEGMHESARRICAAWNVPHILVVPGESTYANREQARLELWEHTVLPLARLMLSDLVPWAGWLYGDPSLDIRIDEDAITALEPRRQTARQGALAAFQQGVISLDEARLVLGYGPAEESENPAEEPAALRNARQADMLAQAQQETLRQPGGQGAGGDGEAAPARGIGDNGGPPLDEEGRAARSIKARVPARHAAGPIYAALAVDRASADALAAWANAQGVPNVVPPAEMHITTVYSRTPVPLYASDDFSTEIIAPDGMALRLLGPEDKPVLVLVVDSALARQRHALARQLGAAWDWPEYIPHITISTDPGGVIPPSLPPFAISIGPEYIEPLDDGEGRASPQGEGKGWESQPRGEDGRWQPGRALSDEQWRDWLRTGSFKAADGREIKMDAPEPDDALLVEEMLPVLRDILRHYGQGVFDQVGIAFGFDIFDPEVVRFLESFGGDRIEELVGTTTREALGAAMAEVIERGGRFDEVIAAIRRVFQDASELRAEAIAMTETTRAAGWATQHAMDRAGVERKRWLSSRDAFVRPTHRALDGQTVPADQPFEANGVSGMHPGALSGGAKENVRCRCVVLALPDEKAAEATDTEEKRDAAWAEASDALAHFEALMAEAVRRGFQRQAERIVVQIARARV